MEALHTSSPCRALTRTAVLVVAAAALAGVAPARGADGPAIVITSAPPSGAGEDTAGKILGRVSGVDPKQTRVVVYAHTDRYYVQPMADRPYTRIGSKLTWKATTHLGWDYAALLVSQAYQPAAVRSALPEVGGDVLAIDIAPANQRVISFSGYDWVVKHSDGAVGPGPNEFSSSTRCVSVDREGRLRLAIRKRGQRWLCAEVVLRASLGYGQYCFELGSPVDRLDPNAVLGLFTWSDAPDFAHRELDIEFSRWGDAEALNAQFVVQPYTDPRNLVRFDLPEGLPVSTHGFQWQPDRVTFRSVRGSGGCTPAPDTVLEEHTFTWGIPQTGGENVRMNLWLFNHTAPTGEGDLEVIVKSFHFTPL